MIILAPGEVLEVTLSPIAEEMLRRQRLADAREADPTLADTWDGSTTQPNYDKFPIEESCGSNNCDHINPDCRCCGDCIACNE
jgi:hypothetical protein